MFEHEQARVRRYGTGRLEHHFHGDSEHHFWHYKRDREALPHWEWDTHQNPDEFCTRNRKVEGNMRVAKFVCLGHW
jgi:hypothetical protein